MLKTFQTVLKHLISFILVRNRQDRRLLQKNQYDKNNLNWSSEKCHTACESIGGAGLSPFKSTAAIFGHQHQHPPPSLKVPSKESIRKFIKSIPKSMYIINSLFGHGKLCSTYSLDNMDVALPLQLQQGRNTGGRQHCSWWQKEGVKLDGGGSDCVLKKLLCKTLLFYT